jgi:hypothetical protein
MSEIRVPVFTAFDNKGIKEAQSSLSALGDRIKSVGKIAAGYMVGAGAVNFVKQSADAAIEFQRAMAGVKSVFGDYTDTVSQFINASEQIGMSHSEAARNVTFLGSVFKKTGIPMQDVINKTESLVSLSADLASTYGGTVNEAMTGIAAMFRGEYDPIERFGVAMKQNQVNAELAARGQSHLTGSAQIAAATLARYDLLIQASTDAHGAFARQTNNLFEQQQILKAEWTDTQQILGNQLTPGLLAMAEAIKPIIANLAPNLSEMFKVIAANLVKLAPLFGVIANQAVASLTVVTGIIATLEPALMPVVEFMANNLGMIVAFFTVFKAANTIGNLAASFVVLKDAEKGLIPIQWALNAAMDANPYFLLAGALAAIAAGVIGIATAVQNNSVPQSVAKAAKMAAAQAQSEAAKTGKSHNEIMQAGLAAAEKVRKDYLDSQKSASNQASQFAMNFSQAYQDAMAKVNNTTTNTAANTTKTTKTWFQTLTEEVKKSTARLKLEAMGASAGLIDSILGSTDWKKTADNIVAGGMTVLNKLQSAFNKTAAGMAEQEKAAADLADRLTKYHDAVAKRLDLIKSLTTGLADIMPKTYAQITADIGQFESDVISATDNLKSSLKSALDTNDISPEAYANLTAYAAKESAALQKIAAQRDAIVKKIEAAKTTYLEVANAVRGYGNITSNTAEQVTETYTKLIDGVQVTVTRTVDALKSGDIVDAYKKIVDKTKAFYQNLVSLKKMGLNATLFKQIIDAGVDAGAATADAIVNGGQDTVASLNDLFSQLDATGAQMGDLTAQVMSNSGVTIVSGFIDGLISQEKDLTDQATAMAKAFSDAFNAAINLVIPSVKAGDFGLTEKQVADAEAKVPVVSAPSILESIGLTSLTGALASGETSWLSGILGNSPTALTPTQMAAVTASNTAANRGDNSSWNANMGNTYNVTLNTGVVADPATLWPTVVQGIKQYERNNGAVWVAV